MGSAVDAGSLSRVNDLLDAYLLSRNYSPTSLRQRRSILRRACDSFDPVTAEVGDVLDWWAGTESLAPASRRASLQAVSGLFAWLEQAGLRDGPNPCTLVVTPRVPKRPPRVLTADECDALRREAAGTVLALPVELGLTMGLRAAEVVALSPGDRDGDWVSVTGKGGHTALVPISASAAALWPSGDTMWPAHPSTLHRRVKIAMSAAGLDPGHAFHSLRRTCATTLADRGVPIHVVSGLLRHSSTATTTRYYTAVAAADLRAAVA